MSSEKNCDFCNREKCRSSWCDEHRWHLTAKSRGHAAVSKAVKAGLLVNLKTAHVKCTDCDKRAVAYDHRDYRKPLDVQPVCNSCNMLRGPAIDIAHVYAERKLKFKSVQ